MNTRKTDQEKFWEGEFGEEYTERNVDKVPSNTSFWANILQHTTSVEKILEIGPNIGENLKAIHNIFPHVHMSGVEINKKAFNELKKLPYVDPKHESILEYEPETKFDFVFTKGVLIHINPENLNHVYDVLYKSSKRYILIAEYYNPNPVEVQYRGHNGKLFKRDFAGEFMDKYPAIELINYGFVWKRDPNFPQDDLTWFLLRKPTDS